MNQRKRKHRLNISRRDWTWYPWRRVQDYKNQLIENAEIGCATRFRVTSEIEILDPSDDGSASPVERIERFGRLTETRIEVRP